jgi:membrane protein implicated in regulation of membrane protease activity
MSAGPASQAHTNPYNAALDAMAGLAIMLGVIAWAAGALALAGFLLGAGAFALVATLSVHSIRLHLSQMSGQGMEASNAAQEGQGEP